MMGLTSLGMLLIPGMAAAKLAPVTGSGVDVSYPQCGQALPGSEPFWIVGVNGGNAKSSNACFSDQWAWATKHATNALSSQPPLSLYVNTGNPGEVLPPVATWPLGPVAGDPYGSCGGGNDAACSWAYGYNRAEQDILNADAVAGNLTAMQWWLDVETVNSWSSNLANNRADLEGMVYAFKQVSPKGLVGLYSSSSMWAAIVGKVPLSDGSGLPSTLYNLNEWRPGATNLQQAQTNCGLPAFAGGGRVILTQYGSGLDQDYRCPGSALP
jgi:hypothetical protein